MKTSYIAGLIIVVLVAAGGYYFLAQHSSKTDAMAESSIQILVTQFGSSLQKVSLSAPDALDEIGSAYSPYVTQNLLSEWKANRAFAPGRGISSPWPDRIDSVGIQKQSDGTYQVTGMVEEVSSQEVTHGGVAAQFPVTLTVAKVGDQWLISSYEAGPTVAVASTSAQQ